MKILVDLHHEDLYRSLLLLAERLGADLFIPKGVEWYTEGKWCVHDHINTANQFLGDEAYGAYPGVSLEDAKGTDWDMVIVTHCNHFATWNEMFSDRSPVVLQVGNNWNYNSELFMGVRNVLNSTSTQWPQALNHVRYHPELEPVADIGIFGYTERGPIGAAYQVKTMCFALLPNAGSCFNTRQGVMGMG